MLLSATKLPAVETKPFEPPPFQLPDGFEIEVVAAPPLVQHPMLAGFDAQGRLFVCESAGNNMDDKQLLEERPNFVHILKDTDGDGRFDTSTRFADKMTFPQGALIRGDSFYCASPPYIWKLTDTDSDGVADVRDPFIGKFNFLGHAGALHGPFFGPTGRFFWCAGPLGHEIHDKQGTLIHQGTASRIFYCREDGTEIDAYCGGGMFNPVELAFTADGDMLGIMTWYNPDEARRDALVHYVYGGVYPKNVPAWIAEFKRTGPLMPPLIRYGVVAPSGIMRYRGIHLGNEYRNNFFISHFNIRTVERVRLTIAGSTYQADAEPFLTSTSPEFHPCDVIEDADGSLLVIDTGGWFAGAGCPTSKISNPQYFGAIYRIRRAGSAKVEDPRGFQIDWPQLTTDQLIGLLKDDRHVVRDRAVDALAERVTDDLVTALEVLEKANHPNSKRRVIWALSRSAGHNVAETIRQALGDTDAGVRLAALHSITMSRDAAALAAVLPLLHDPDRRIRRQAAAVLARLGNLTAVGPLLGSLADPVDRILEHALIYALIEIDDRDGTLAGLTDESPRVRRAALIALDQMDHGELSRDMVAPLLNTGDRQLQQTALEIIVRHAGWAGETLPLLLEWLREPSLPPERQQALRDALLTMSNELIIQQFIAERLIGDETSLEQRLLLLDVIANHELQESPAIWREPIDAALASPNEQLARQAIRSAEQFGTVSFLSRLHKVMGGGSRSPETKFAAAVALARSGQTVDDITFDTLVGYCRVDSEALDRMAAADALSTAELTNEQLSALIDDTIPNAGPMVLRTLLRAFEKNVSSKLGIELIAVLQQAAGLTNLTTEQLTAAVQNCPEEVHVAAKPLLERIRNNSRLTSARLKEMESQVTGGHAERGRAVFYGKKALCHACHQVHGEGGAIGPDLSLIGQVRTPRDLLEALLAPNATFARGYEPFIIALHNGKTHSGVISRRSEDAIYLGTTDGKEIRIANSEIEEVRPSSTSVMPQGLDKQLNRQELSDLIAFLRSLKK